MSVIIKGMKKPKSCFKIVNGEYEYCPFVNTDDDCVILLKKGICEGTWTDQYNKCPLGEVPEPHGRLIDADALIVNTLNKMSGNYAAERVFYELCHAVNTAPTVIEADGEE